MGFVFNRGALGLQNGTINWSANTIKARLSRTSETLSKDSTSMTGLGVASTDVTLASKTGPTEDLGTDRIGYDAADPTFPTVSGAEVNKLIIFKFGTNDADSVPIAALDVTPTTPNGGDLLATLDPAGAFFTQQ